MDIDDHDPYAMPQDEDADFWAEAITVGDEVEAQEAAKAAKSTANAPPLFPMQSLSTNIFTDARPNPSFNFPMDSDPLPEYAPSIDPSLFVNTPNADYAAPTFNFSDPSPTRNDQPMNTCNPSESSALLLPPVTLSDRARGKRKESPVVNKPPAKRQIKSLSAKAVDTSFKRSEEFAKKMFEIENALSISREAESRAQQEALLAHRAASLAQEAASMARRAELQQAEETAKAQKECAEAEARALQLKVQLGMPQRAPLADLTVQQPTTSNYAPQTPESHRHAYVNRQVMHGTFHNPQLATPETPMHPQQQQQTLQRQYNPCNSPSTSVFRRR